MRHEWKKYVNEENVSAWVKSKSRHAALDRIDGYWCVREFGHEHKYYSTLSQLINHWWVSGRGPTDFEQFCINRNHLQGERLVF